MRHGAHRPAARASEGQSGAPPGAHAGSPDLDRPPVSIRAELHNRGGAHHRGAGRHCRSGFLARGSGGAAGGGGRGACRLGVAQLRARRGQHGAREENDNPASALGGDGVEAAMGAAGFSGAVKTLATPGSSVPAGSLATLELGHLVVLHLDDAVFRNLPRSDELRGQGAGNTKRTAGARSRSRFQTPPAPQLPPLCWPQRARAALTELRAARSMHCTDVVPSERWTLRERGR